jgi:glutamyl-tRNA reductase
MPLVVLGLSHRTAPPEVRNRHAFPPARVTEALCALHDYPAVREAAILATCNRLEIYADVDDFESGVAALKEFLTTYRNMRVDDFDKYLYTLLGAQAVEQLFRVACGIDSMIIGEAEIVAQVRQALAAASAASTAGPHLNRLFRVALQTGKRARTETPVGRDAVSFAAAAVELAGRHRTLGEAHCLVIGAGKIAAAAAKHLAARQPARLTIANRTLGKARSLAAQLGAAAIDLDALPQALAASDVAISATGAPGYVVDGDVMRRAYGRDQAGGRVIVDIAMPRDVEPEAATLHSVTLYELADLHDIIDGSLGGRRAAIPAVEAIIAAQLREYMRWYQARSAVPLIASLRSKAEQIRAAEIGKLLARLPELDERQRRLIVAASVTIMNKLLHAPLMRIRETAAAAAQPPGDDQALQRLFDLTRLSDRLERELSAKILPAR